MVPVQQSRQVSATRVVSAHKFDDRHDLHQLLRHALDGVVGGEKLAALMLRYHAAAITLYREGHISTTSEFSFTLRTLLRTVKLARRIIQSGAQPLTATIWAILRCYTSPAADEKSRCLLEKALSKTFQEKLQNGLAFWSGKYSISRSPQTDAVPYQVDFQQNIVSLITSLEQDVHDFFAAVLLNCPPNASAGLVAFAFITTVSQPLSITKMTQVAREAFKQNCIALKSNFDSALLQSLLTTLGHNRVDATSFQRSGQAIVEIKTRIVATCAKLESQVETYASNATFNDCEMRSRLLSDLLACISKLQSLAANRMFQASLGGEQLQSYELVTKSLTTLTQYEKILAWMKMLFSPELTSSLRRIEREADICSQRGVAFLFFQQIQKPVVRIGPALWQACDELIRDSDFDTQLVKRFFFYCRAGRQLNFVCIF